MDNIGSQVSAISCLLPLLASLLLALHFIKLPKRHTSNSPPLQQEISSALFLAADREIQITPVVLTQSKTPVKLNQPFKDVWKAEKASANRSETIEIDRQLLAGCESGLLRMRVINRAYFSSGKAANRQVEIRKMRPKRSDRQLKGFLPTHLTTIIEGLQY